MNKFFYLILICSHFVFAVSPEDRTCREQALISHVMSCIDKAEHGVSRLSQEALQVDGLSSAKVRHFLNNLCSLPNTTYLEIGCYKGSTWVASLFGNQDSVAYAYAIDNWSEFGCHEDEFIENCRKFISFERYHFLSVDSFSEDARSIITRPVTVYFYDGFHSVDCQELAFTYYNDQFDDVFIAVVDDWNWAAVQEGTEMAFQKQNYQVLFEKAMFSPRHSDAVNWWNGLYVAVIRKPSL